MNQAAALRRPGFLRHLALLWWLRMAVGLNKGTRRGRWVAVAGFLLGTLPAWGLGPAFYGLLTHPAIAQSDEWSEFCLNLLCFVTSMVWCTWPILSAGVDDHSELSRFVAFPISGVRLLVASTVASLIEPRSIVIYAPLVGGALGFAHTHPLASPTMAVLLFVTFALLNAAWGRAGLNMVLNVLRQPRSAELIGGFFVLVLFACSFIPPVDTSWLSKVGGGLSAFNINLISNAAHALGRVPSGFLGEGLFALASGEPGVALAYEVALVGFTALGFGVAYRLLLQFNRYVSRSAASATRDANPFARTTTPFATLVTREALDLWHNPRARLLAAVPFVLAILLKLVSARDLFSFFLGRTADAWVLGSLCVYAAVVMASTFSQNMFAYDGHGLSLLLAAPVDLGEVMRAKNVVHGGAAGALAVGVGVFYGVYFRTASWLDWLCAMAAVACVIPVLLAAGNYLSVFFPVKFHANLRRRDKVPFAVSMLGVAATSVGTGPFALSLRLDGGDGISWRSVAQVTLCAGLAWGAYFVSRDAAVGYLRARGERILQAVTRE